MRSPLGSTAPDPARGGRRENWRSDVMTASGLNVVAGLWLVIAPWTLIYGAGDPRWNDVVFGGLIAVLALARVAGAVRASGLSLLNSLFGVWLVASAFWLDNTSAAFWNDLIVGIVVVVLGFLSASASEERPRPRPQR